MKRTMAKGNSDYYYGFDYLRAFLPLFVIAIHTHAISRFGNLYSGKNNYPNIYDVVQFNLLCLAVPAFFLISLVLFFKKTRNFKEDLSKVYIKMVLALFWCGLWVLFTGSTPRWELGQIIIFIVTGGNSIFYFLFSLVFLTLLASLIRKAPVRVTWGLLIFTLIFINISFPLLNMYDARYKYLVVFWNPLSFLACVFAAKLLVHYENSIRNSRKFIPILFAAFVMISFVEWRTLIHPNHKLILSTAFPPYARVSPLIGATLLLCLSFLVKREALFIAGLSAASLGMYCVHPFLLGRLQFIEGAAGTPFYFAAVALSSLGLTVALKRILHERLI